MERNHGGYDEERFLAALTRPSPLARPAEPDIGDVGDIGRRVYEPKRPSE